MTKIFVGGITPWTTEITFTDYFCQFGQVEYANLVRDRYSGQCKGYGFVVYKCGDAVKMAMRRRKHNLNGKMVVVMLAHSETNRRGKELGARTEYRNQTRNLKAVHDSPVEDPCWAPEPSCTSVPFSNLPDYNNPGQGILGEYPYRPPMRDSWGVTGRPLFKSAPVNVNGQLTSPAFMTCWPTMMPPTFLGFPGQVLPNGYMPIGSVVGGGFPQFQFQPAVGGGFIQLPAPPPPPPIMLTYRYSLPNLYYG